MKYNMPMPIARCGPFTIHVRQYAYTNYLNINNAGSRWSIY